MEKLSLTKCRSMLEKDGDKYTDEEVTQIRDLLYTFAEIDYNVFKKQDDRDKEFGKQPDQHCKPCNFNL